SRTCRVRCMRRASREHALRVLPMIIDVAGAPVYAYTGSRTWMHPSRTVMFVHGAAHDHSVWALQSRYFAHHGFDVLAVDLPGHGRSAGPALDSVEAMASWVLGLLDANGIKQAMLAGHSLGSLVALDACRQGPDRVSRLALL